MKKIVSSLLTLLFLFSFLPLLSYAAGGRRRLPPFRWTSAITTITTMTVEGADSSAVMTTISAAEAVGNPLLRRRRRQRQHQRKRYPLWIGVALVVLVIFFVIKSKTGHTEEEPRPPSRTGTPCPPHRPRCGTIPKKSPAPSPKPTLSSAPDRFIGWSKEVRHPSAGLDGPRLVQNPSL